MFNKNNGSMWYFKCFDLIEVIQSNIIYEKMNFNTTHYVCFIKHYYVPKG